VISTAGAGLLGFGLLATLANLGLALVNGPRSGRNPWGARSYEWLTASPPPKQNFPEPLTVTRGPYDFHLPES
jgi:cytochrome c oxidase subunit 1